jgi:hypothetical protein
MNARRQTVIAVALLSLLQSGALAGHTEPAKAKKAQFPLVNGFQFCASNCSDDTPARHGDHRDLPPAGQAQANLLTCYSQAT